MPKEIKQPKERIMISPETGLRRIPNPPRVDQRHDFAVYDAKGEAISTVTIMFREVIWLTNVWTHGDHRGKGLSKLCLEEAVRVFADKDIYLMISPYTDSPLNEEQLAWYYHSFGFENTEVPGVMVRWAKVWAGRVISLVDLSNG